ncbi:uncharacterized protein [Triticum aestivum]|uniref:uncharacterized protein n=1 Tax=Triticum aestivum TaxID=4565 RepID=UPI001D014059|nr:uncharacterized protein LOC123083258 [Triticum aestivum]
MSDKFSVGGHDWYIVCCPNGDVKESEGHISLFLWHASHVKTGDATTTIMLSIRDKLMKPSCSNVGDCHFDGNAGWGWKKFIKHQDLNKEELLKDDCLSILCHLTVAEYADEQITASMVSTPGPVQQQATGSHVFRIQEFTQVRKKVANGEEVFSCTFSVGGHDWYISLYPNGEREEADGYISLFLRHHSHATTGQATATYKMSILDKACKPSCTKIKEGHCFTSLGWGWVKFMKLEDLNKEEHLKDDCLSVLCDVTVEYTQDHQAAAVSPIMSTPRLLSALSDTGRQQITASTVAARQATGSHVFRIEGFTRLKEKVINGSPVTSKPFHVGGYDWLIQCYPNGYKKKSKGCISLYLHRQDSHAQTGVVMASYKMSILNTCWKPFCTCTSLEEEHYTNNALGWEKFMKHEDLDKEKHLKDDCLYILCDVSVDLGLHTGDYNDEIAAAEETKPAPPELEEAIWKKQASDVKTKVSAHRWLRLICWPIQD